MPKQKAIQNPDTLLEYFNEYKEWCKSNPRKKHVFVGKDGTSDYELLERPLTHEGFLIWVFEEKGLDINRYYYNVNDECSEYVSICSRIKESIRRDQIEGGLVGQYNSSITQRLNGLVDKQENTIKGEPRIFNV